MAAVSFRRVIRLVFLMGGLFSVLHAQEYRFEIGGAGGGAFYMGDANKNTPFKGMNPAFGGIFRYNLNFRWAVKGNLMWGQVSGTTAGTGNALPENAQAAFKRNLFELGGQMEFNFFPYSDKFTYAYTKRFSPYVLLGLGATVAPGNGRTFAGVNLPVGLGVKYKIANRFNVACELSIRKLFRDDLDVNSNAILDNPYQTGRNFLKNNDWYAFLLLSLTWDFGLRCSTCNNSDNIPGL